MSQENVEVVRSAWVATLEEDWPTALGVMDSELEVHDFDVPDAGVFHGHEGFLAWLALWGEGWESWRVEDLDLRAVGEDQVLATFQMVTTGSTSGLEMRRSDAIVYRLSREKIVRMEYFNDQHQALAAVGLPE